MDSAILFLLLLILILLVIIVLIYNSLISKKNQVKNAFSTIDVYLKQRYDLIPNIVEAVKEYMKHERHLLEKITQIRTTLTSGQVNEKERFKLEGEITNILGRIFAIAENYPVLKASENFLHLQKTLNDVEEKIAAARRFYNTSVTELNNAIEMFPSNIIAKLMKLKKTEWLEIPEPNRENVYLSELFKK